MAREKVGPPISVALTPSQRDWIDAQDRPVSETIRHAIDHMMYLDPLSPLRGIVSDMESEILRLQAAGEDSGRIEAELLKVWKLIVNG